MSSTQPKPAPRGWARFLLPSVTDLLFLALLFSLASPFAVRLLNDGDIGWHIRNGELMLQTHSITRADPFSSTMAGKPWCAWEWLYDLLSAGLYHTAALNGVVFFTALLIALTLALAFRLMVSRGTYLPLAVVLLLLAAGASAIHWLTRPHVVSWLLIAVWFHLLDSWEAAASPARLGKLLWLPLLMLLWVNLHAGFVTGFALLAIYLLSECIERFARQHRAGAGKRLKPLAAISGLSLLASLVNPFGYKLHVHVYQYLTDRWLMDHIDEFRSPNFHGAAEQCFALLLLITIGALALSRERPRISHLLVILFAVSSGLYASRSLPISAILLVLVVGPILSRAVAAAAAGHSLSAGLERHTLRWESFSARMGSIELALRGHLWPLLATLLLAAAALAGGRLGSWQIMDAHFDPNRFPVEAVDWLAQSGNQQPIFCPDFWSGYVIFRLHPETKVVLDDRHDLYGEEFFKSYLKAVRAEAGWNEALQQNDVRLVLMPSDSPLASVLRESPGWKTAYRDGVAIIFKRGQI